MVATLHVEKNKHGNLYSVEITSPSGKVDRIAVSNYKAVKGKLVLMSDRAVRAKAMQMVRDINTPMR